MSRTAGEGCATFELRPRPPYRLDLTVWALRRRDRNRLDRWDGSYRRAVLVQGQVCALRVRQVGDLGDPTLIVDVDVDVDVDVRRPDVVAELETQVRRLLGTDIDLTPFYVVADAHPLTRDLKERFLGVHPPRFPTVFEALVNAVANQQLSLEVGLTLLNRLSCAFGVAAPGEAGLVSFPTARAILDAAPDAIRRLGFSARKTDYLRSIAATELDLPDLDHAERAEVTRRLMAIRGVGRWSAEYVLLRGLGRLEVFPGDDVGARHRLRRLFDLDHDPGYAEIAERLRPWDPYAGLLYFHLLLLGLAERGQIPE